MNRRIWLVLSMLFGAVASGVSVRLTVHAQEAAPAWVPSRVSTAALPKVWGQVRGVLGRDEITLILEDDAGTVRAVTLERSISADGRTGVTPRLFTVIQRQ